MNYEKLRKKLFVNQAIQGRLLVRAALYWFLYHGVLWMTLFLFRYAEHRGTVLAGAPPRTFSDLYHEFTHQYVAIWICAAAIVPIVLWDLLCFSHRIVGPLFRFRKTLESLSAGRTVSEIRLRDGDLLNELNDTFNRYLATLQTFRPMDLKSTIEDKIALEVSQLQAEVDLMKNNQSTPEPDDFHNASTASTSPKSANR